ncbi:MAG: periplasmic heavy metal sensor [Deltaproteobacteria bacterium]|nr:MAG: periplasmic heavy metal sensor [Deltaproteobacteria bacterium]
MKRIVTIAGIVLLVAAIALPAFAHGRGRGRGHDRMGNWQGSPDCCWHYDKGYTSLTEEQRDQLNKLRQELYDENAKLRNDIRTKSVELNSILNSPDPDPEKAKALQKEISDLRTTMAQNRVNFELEARKIAPELRFGRGYGPGRSWN